MYTEPQNITVGSTTTGLARVAFGDRKGIFSDATTGLRFTIAHALGKRNRTSVRLDFTKISNDPLMSGRSERSTGSVSTVLDVSPTGFTPVELEDHLQALGIWLSDQTNRDKLINGES